MKVMATVDLWEVCGDSKSMRTCETVSSSGHAFSIIAARPFCMMHGACAASVVTAVVVAFCITLSP
jgi:hypothetical protein